MYLITGSTGHVGRCLIDHLHSGGHDVRALVRDRTRADLLPDGIDIAVGDLDVPDTVAAALHGVDGAFLMHVAPGTTQTEIFIDTARSTGVNRVVFLSSIGARLIPLGGPIPATLAAREDLFRESGLEVTYLRPNGFMSNALWWADGIREQNRVVDATYPGCVPVVDPDDIARVAALMLTEDGHAGHGYILNGPEALTARDQVEIISDVLGRTIDFAAVTPEQFAQDSVARGTAVQLAEALRHLNELFRAGRAGVIAEDIENLTHVAPRTFREWCERHVDAFRGA